jgi:predicted nucleic acid-binding protein
MTAYIDSSVLLRILMAQTNRLKQWRAIERAVSSELIRVECLRTIDRLRLAGSLDDREISLRREAALYHLSGFDLIALDSAVLERAADPFPTALGTLDALHLASALMARHDIPELRFATHDRELATAARAIGFEVLS